LRKGLMKTKAIVRQASPVQATPPSRPPAARASSSINPFKRIQPEIDRLGAASIIDVGTADGTHSLYRRFPNAELLLVEPLQEYEAAIQSLLSERQGSYEMCALGAAPGTARIEIAGTHLKRTSFLKRTELTEFTSEPRERRDVPIKTLDAVVRAHAPRPPYGLKIDTEGFELEVLKGGTETLKSTVWVVSEVSVSQRFEGSYTFMDLMTFLYDHGFVLSNILHVSRRDKLAKYADMLFVNSRSQS
jgi:FkbM family methyltransferase